MASRRQVLLLAAAAIAVAFLAAPASAEDRMVGDGAGWTLPFPASWTDGKTFKVGDTLMFMYTAGEHTVVEVTGAGFKACSKEGENQLGAWASGDDTVPLDRPGKRWFICGVDDHCAKGMKFVVDVDDGAAPGPGGPPVSSAPAGAVSRTAAMAVTAGAVAAAALMF